MNPLSVVDNRIEVERSTFCDTFTGTREDLIAAGAATAAMFPEGRKRTKDNFGEDVPKEWEYATRYVKGGRWQVTRWHERREDDREWWEPDAFRRTMTTIAARSFGSLMTAIESGNPHRFSTEDRERIDQGFRNILDVFVQAEIVRPEPDRPSLRLVE